MHLPLPLPPLRQRRRPRSEEGPANRLKPCYMPVPSQQPSRIVEMKPAKKGGGPWHTVSQVVLQGFAFLMAIQVWWGVCEVCLPTHGTSALKMNAGCQTCHSSGTSCDACLGFRGCCVHVLDPMCALHGSHVGTVGSCEAVAGVGYATGLPCERHMGLMWYCWIGNPVSPVKNV